MKKIITAAWSEVCWWGRLLGQGTRHQPGHVVVVIAFTWLAAPWLPWPHALVLPGLVLALRIWWILSPTSCHSLFLAPVRNAHRKHWIRRNWADVATACGLAAELNRRTTGTAWPESQVPSIRRMTSRGTRIQVTVRPLLGQTVEDFERVNDRLRTSVGATRARVDLEPPNDVRLTFTVGDTLAEPFKAREPALTTHPLTSHVWMGRCEDGTDWRLPLGPHTLVAGCSGSGKGSVLWSLAFGLAPWVKTGLVRLHGIDLKGGMEILMGADLFSTCATTPAEAVAVLEQLVAEMQKRTKEYAGRVRSHTATEDEPLNVVLIDELAALTAYCPERDLQRRAEMAINMLCSQGRAPGFTVFACLQDPRKEVIPSRGLFTQMVGLRLKDMTETAMVLGDAAMASGAHCHRITRATPGMGYICPEEGGYPVRVRAGHASDQAIRLVAEAFASPFHQSVIIPDRTAADELRTLRRRNSRGSGAA